MKKITRSKDLALNIKIWWLLNAITFINLAVILIGEYYYLLSGDLYSNRSFHHFLYNISSPPMIPAFFIFMLCSMLIFGVEHATKFLNPGQITVALVVFGISIVTNFFIAKILASQFVVNLYRRWFGHKKILLLLIILLIGYLFYVG